MVPGPSDDGKAPEGGKRKGQGSNPTTQSVEDWLAQRLAAAAGDDEEDTDDDDDDYDNAPTTRRPTVGAASQTPPTESRAVRLREAPAPAPAPPEAAPAKRAPRSPPPKATARPAEAAPVARTPTPPPASKAPTASKPLPTSKAPASDPKPPPDAKPSPKASPARSAPPRSAPPASVSVTPPTQSSTPESPRSSPRPAPNPDAPLLKPVASVRLAEAAINPSRASTMPTAPPPPPSRRSSTLPTQPPSDGAVDDDDDPYPDFEIEPLPSEDVEPLLTEEVDPIETHSATDEVPHPRAAPAPELDAWDLFGEESGVRTGPRPMVAVGPGTPAGADRPVSGVDEARVSALIAEAERSKPKRPFGGRATEPPSDVPTQESPEPDASAQPVPRPLDRAGMFDEVPATQAMSATERAFFLEDPGGAAVDDEPGTQWMPPPSIRSPRPAPAANAPLGLAEDIDQLPGEATVVRADTRAPSSSAPSAPPSAAPPAPPQPQPEVQAQPQAPASAMVVDDGPTITAKAATGTPTMIRKAYGTHDDDDDVGVTVPAEVSYTVITWMSVVLGVSLLVVTALVFVVLVYPFW